MYKILSFSPRICFGNLLCRVMSKTGDRAYYAVVRGRETGIYDTWKECKVHVDGVSDAKFKKFFSLKEAEEYINFWKNYSQSSQGAVKQNNVSRWANCTNTKIVRNCDANGANKRWPAKKNKSSERVKRNSFVLGCTDKGTDSTDVSQSGFTKSCFKLPYVSPISGFSNTNVTNVFNDQMSVKSESNTLLKKEKDVFDVISLIEDIKVEPEIEEQLNENKNVSEVASTMSSCNYNGSNLVEMKFNDPKLSAPNSCSTVKPSSGSNTAPCDAMKSPELDKKSSGDTGADAEHNNSQRQLEQEQSNNQTNTDQSVIPCAKCGMKNERTNNFAELLNLLLNSVENINKPERLAYSLKLFINKLFSSTNGSVNPQMNVDEVETETVQSSLGRNSEELQNASNCMDQPEEHQQHLFSTPKNISSSHTPVVDMKTEQKSADVMALNLRLDSFEKRFDSCLKEVGGIFAELSHIKAEIKEIKETITGCNSILSHSNSPIKRGGLHQTTLNFTGNKFETDRGYPTSEMSQSDVADGDSAEPAAKKSRNLKRKLSVEDSKQSADSGSDLLNFYNIKTEAVDYTSFTVDSDGFVQVYTDGACHLNGQKGAKAGIGIWFGDCHPLNIAEPVEGSATNNSAEIQAARVAIDLAVRAGVKKLKIHTDSEFLINCATKWIRRWKKNDWTLVDGGKVKNRTELEKLDALASKIKVRWVKVEAHVGIKGNEMADRLANEGAAKYST